MKELQREVISKGSVFAGFHKEQKPTLPFTLLQSVTPRLERHKTGVEEIQIHAAQLHPNHGAERALTYLPQLKSSHGSESASKPEVSFTTQNSGFSVCSRFPGMGAALAMGLVSTAHSEPPAAVSPAAHSPWLCLQTSPLIKASEPGGKSQLQNGWGSFISNSGFTLQIIIMINIVINIKYVIFLKHLAGKKKSRTPSFPPIPPQKSHEAEGLGSSNAVGDEHLHMLCVP